MGSIYDSNKPLGQLTVAKDLVLSTTGKCSYFHAHSFNIGTQGLYSQANDNRLQTGTKERLNWMRRWLFKLNLKLGNKQKPDSVHNLITRRGWPAAGCS